MLPIFSFQRVRRPQPAAMRFVFFTRALAFAAVVSLAFNGVAAATRAPIVFFDGPLADFSDEGLPYSLTAAFPTSPDPITRWLGAVDARWTVGTGFASVYDNFDTGTNSVRDRGRDGLLFNAGRQTLWPVPVTLPAGSLRLELEAGLNYTTRSLPANGTHLSFSLFAGFEWSSAPDDPREWIAGIRWFHLSHGGLFGVNGGYDGLLFRVGRRWNF